MNVTARDDLADFALIVGRTLEDDGARVVLDEVIEYYGLTRAELEDELAADPHLRPDH